MIFNAEKSPLKDPQRQAPIASYPTLSWIKRSMSVDGWNSDVIIKRFIVCRIMGWIRLSYVACSKRMAVPKIASKKHKICVTVNWKREKRDMKWSQTSRFCEWLGKVYRALNSGDLKMWFYDTIFLSQNLFKNSIKVSTFPQFRHPLSGSLERWTSYLTKNNEWKGHSTLLCWKTRDKKWNRERLWRRRSGRTEEN